MRKKAISSNSETRKPLDSIDRKLLDALQRDAEQSNLALAAQVGLSPAPCSRRVKRLREEGVIQRQVALVDQWERTALAFGQTVDDARYAEMLRLSRYGVPYAAASAVVRGPVAAMATA